MPRTFDGVDDVITTSLGACGTTAWDAMTAAAIVKVTDDDATARCVFALGAAAGRPRLQLAATTRLITLAYSGTSLANTLALPSSDGWALIAVCRAAGTSTARIHKYVYSTGVYSVEDDNATATADTTAPVTSNMIGRNQGGSAFWEGDILVAGAWRGTKFTDDQIKALPHNLLAWYAVRPTVLWLLDQVSTSIAVGDHSRQGADQSAITGTALSTTAPPFVYGRPTEQYVPSFAALARAGSW